MGWFWFYHVLSLRASRFSSTSLFKSKQDSTLGFLKARKVTVQSFFVPKKGVWTFGFGKTPFLWFFFWFYFLVLYQRKCVYGSICFLLFASVGGKSHGGLLPKGNGWMPRWTNILSNEPTISKGFLGFSGVSRVFFGFSRVFWGFLGFSLGFLGFSGVF